jgi:hypothetical protein
VIAFIDHFNTRLVAVLNYSVIANFHTLKITTTHAKSFQSSFISRSLVAASNSKDSSAAPTKSSLHRFPYTLLTIDLQFVSDRVENAVHYCTPIIFVGTYLFAKALASNGSGIFAY